MSSLLEPIPFRVVLLSACNMHLTIFLLSALDSANSELSPSPKLEWSLLRNASPELEAGFPSLSLRVGRDGPFGGNSRAPVIRS